MQKQTTFNFELWRNNDKRRWSRLTNIESTHVIALPTKKIGAQTSSDFCETNDFIEAHVPHLAKQLNHINPSIDTLSITESNPLILDWRNKQASQKSAGQRLYIEAQNGGVCDLIELMPAHLVSPTYRAHEIHVRSGTTLRHWLLEVPNDITQTNDTTPCGALSFRRTLVERNATIERHYLGLGHFSKNIDHTVLTGERAHASVKGLFLPNRSGAEWDIHAHVIHDAPQTTSDNDFRGLASDGGVGIWNSIVTINKGADGSDSKQLNHNIILGQKSQIHTKPELIIFTDDVTASHGCTCGALDEDALFYLRTRGLSKEQAELLLIEAFLAETTPPQPKSLDIDIQAIVRQHRLEHKTIGAGA